METSEIESDMSTSQLCDWPAVIGNSISTAISVLETDTSESLKKQWQEATQIQGS